MLSTDPSVEGSEERPKSRMMQVERLQEVESQSERSFQIALPHQASEDTPFTIIS